MQCRLRSSPPWHIPLSGSSLVSNNTEIHVRIFDLASTSPSTKKPLSRLMYAPWKIWFLSPVIAGVAKAESDELGWWAWYCGILGDLREKKLMTPIILFTVVAESDGRSHFPEYPQNQEWTLIVYRSLRCWKYFSNVLFSSQQRWLDHDSKESHEHRSECIIACSAGNKTSVCKSCY